MTDLLNYSRRLEEAGLHIVRGVIEEVASNGLPGDHHFYLTFETDHTGVEIADRLRESYPGEMTVVLQHQYEDLEVDAEGFSVTLSFSSVPYHLRVPWTALRRFVDPAANFGLEFHGAPRPEAETEKLGPRPVASAAPSASSRSSPPDGQDAASSTSVSDERQGAGVLTGPQRLPRSPSTAPQAAGDAETPESAKAAAGDASDEAEPGSGAREDSADDQVVRLEDFRKK